MRELSIAVVIYVLTLVVLGLVTGTVRADDRLKATTDAGATVEFGGIVSMYRVQPANWKPKIPWFRHRLHAYMFDADQDGVQDECQWAAFGVVPPDDGVWWDGSTEFALVFAGGDTAASTDWYMADGPWEHEVYQGDEGWRLTGGSELFGRSLSGMVIVVVRYPAGTFDVDHGNMESNWARFDADPVALIVHDTDDNITESTVEATSLGAIKAEYR